MLQQVRRLRKSPAIEAKMSRIFSLAASQQFHRITTYCSVETFFQMCNKDLDSLLKVAFVKACEGNQTAKFSRVLLDGTLLGGRCAMCLKGCLLSGVRSKLTREWFSCCGSGSSKPCGRAGQVLRHFSFMLVVLAMSGMNGWFVCSF